MNKITIIDNISNEYELTKAQTKEIFEKIFNEIETAVKTHDEFAIPGFGKFVLVRRGARKARNPRTGEEIMTKPSLSVKFKISKTLKDKVNN